MTGTRQTVLQAIEKAWDEARFSSEEMADQVTRALEATTNTDQAGEHMGRTATEWAESYQHLQRTHQETLQAIHEYQKRLHAELDTIFAVETPEGYRHIGSDYDTAHLAATRMHDDAHVVAQTRGPWKRVSPAPVEQPAGN